jgi:hypothetical protein
MLNFIITGIVMMKGNPSYEGVFQAVIVHVVFGIEIYSKPEGISSFPHFIHSCIL